VSRIALGVLSLTLLSVPVQAADVPANGWVVWASNRKDSRHEIYLMKADGTGVTRLTFSGGKFPGWSPDAKWIAYTYTTDDSTHVMRHDGSGDKKVCDGTFEFWMWDKSGLVCRSVDDHYLVNPDTGAKSLLFKKSDFTKVGSKALNPGGITHDGRYLVAHSDIFRNGFTGDNGTFKAYHAAVILDFQNKGKLYFFGSGCEPNTPPSGDLIYHVCGDCPTYPDPYRMNVKDIATRSSYAAEIAHADADWGHEYFPRISNDNVWLAYGATTGCHDHETCDYEIWIHRLGAGSANRTRITTNTANDQWPHLHVGTLPTFGCTSAADCDDSDPCTADTCSGGKCQNSAVSGCCTANSQCDDSDPCTADVCSGNTCQNSAISGCCTKDADCDDKNPCTTDTCSGGKCQTGSVAGCCAKDADCDDSNPCTTDTCDTSSGACANAATSGCCAYDTDCDDSDPCTLDTCDTSTNTCQHAAICADAGADSAPDGGPGELGPGSDLAAPDAGIGATAQPLEKLVGGCSLAGRGGSAPPALLLLLGLGLLGLRARGAGSRRPRR